MLAASYRVALLIIPGLMMIGFSPSNCFAGDPFPESFCGGFALSIAGRTLLSNGPTPDQLLKSLGDPVEGYSMARLKEESERLGLHVKAVSTTLENLRARREPFLCLTLINNNHYVVLYDVTDRHVSFVDYPLDKTITVDAWETIWSPNALLLSTIEIEEEEAVTSRVRNGRVYRWMVPALVSAVVVAILLWLFSIRCRRAGALLLVLPFCGCNRPNETSAPSAIQALVIDLSSIDLGIVNREDYADKPLRVFANIVNNHSRAVRLQGVSVSFACTKATLDLKLLAPRWKVASLGRSGVWIRSIQIEREHPEPTVLSVPITALIGGLVR